MNLKFGMANFRDNRTMLYKKTKEAEHKQIVFSQ